MNEQELEIKNLKSCFGNYEDSPCSWHCFGCIFTNECREFCAERMGGENE